MLFILVLALGVSAEEPPVPEALQKALQNPAEARVLDLAGLGLEQVPPAVFKLTALTSLCLNDNQLSALPPELAGLTHLEVLWVRGNHIESWAPLAQLPALKNLDLSGNGLTQVPIELLKLAALEQLSLGQNRLMFLPQAFCFRLPNLQVLDLTSNELKSVPAELKELKSLKVLALSANPLPDADREKLKADLPGVDVTW